MYRVSVILLDAVKNSDNNLPPKLIVSQDICCVSNTICSSSDVYMMLHCLVHVVYHGVLFIL